MESVVGVHVQCVHTQVVGVKPQRLENLGGIFEGGVGQSDAISMDENKTSATTNLGDAAENRSTWNLAYLARVKPKTLQNLRGMYWSVSR